MKWAEQADLGPLRSEGIHFDDLKKEEVYTSYVV